MSKESVRLPREAADSFDAMEHDPNWKYKLIADLYHKGIDDLDECTVVIKKYLSRHESSLIFKILANGYEVEETPEDKIRINYEVTQENINQGRSDTEYWKGVREGVVNTLATLSIKIDGVNS